jgi:predicted DNA-binding protein
MSSVQIRITVSPEIDRLLEKAASKLGKKKSTLARELMEQKMYDLKLMQSELLKLVRDP